jgi:bifunctional oxygenase/reductase
VLAPRQITINIVAPGLTNNGDPVFSDPEALKQMAAQSVADTADSFRQRAEDVDARATAMRALLGGRG